MGRTAVHKLVIPSELAEATKVVEMVARELVARHFNDHALFGIRLALEEAVSNAIRHGNHCDASKHVVVEYSVTPRQVRIKVQDEGPGFLPEQVPDPTLDENLCRPGGRGVMLMKAYMNKVTFNKAGNCVTMVKLRRS